MSKHKHESDGITVMLAWTMMLPGFCASENNNFNIVPGLFVKPEGINKQYIGRYLRAKGN